MENEQVETIKRERQTRDLIRPNFSIRKVYDKYISCAVMCSIVEINNNNNNMSNIVKQSK